MTPLSPESRSILADARDADGLDPAQKERLKGQLMAQIAGAAVAGAAITTAASATAKTTQASLLVLGATTAAKSGLIAFAIMAAAGTGYRMWSSPPAPAASAVAASSAPQASMGPPPPVTTFAASAVEAPAAPVTEAPSAPRPAASSIAAETDLLRRAHRALAAGNGREALALLDRHRSDHPQGALAEEREAARVLALCDAGRPAEARAEAQRFLSRFPRSPHRARVVSACEKK